MVAFVSDRTRSCNCRRVCLVVPRISSDPAAPAPRRTLPLSVSSVPQWKFKFATTVPPRVFFGSRTSFMPLGSVTLGYTRLNAGRRGIEGFAFLRGSATDGSAVQLRRSGPQEARSPHASGTPRPE